MRPASRPRSPADQNGTVAFPALRRSSGLQNHSRVTRRDVKDAASCTPYQATATARKEKLLQDRQPNCSTAVHLIGPIVGTGGESMMPKSAKRFSGRHHAL